MPERHVHTLVLRLSRPVLAVLLAAGLCLGLARAWAIQEPPAAPAPNAAATSDTSHTANTAHPAQPEPGGKAPAKDEPRDQVSLTTHTVTIAGQPISYTATAGTLVLKQDDPKAAPRASVFYVAYTRECVADPARRPLIFAFNGGPGSSSVWLQLGLLGPRRVRFAEPGQSAAPPYQLIDNPYSLLDIADLVFIDPVGTGYSRPAEGVDPKQFHGVREDVEAIGEFIRLYTTRQGRWASPKFLAGESYGTTRAALLADHLQTRLGMYVNGVVLVSTVLDFQTIDDSGNSDLAFILYLPTYAATAWYHHRLAPELQNQPLEKVLAEAEQFAMGPYAAALLRGRLAPEELARLAQAMARLTGLPAEYLQQSNLRVSQDRFSKELLRSTRRTVGRFDGRYTGVDRDAAGEHTEYDPSYAALYGSFSAALNDYMRHELRFDSDRPYEILTGKVYPWNFSEYENRYLNVTDALRHAMSYNPALRLFAASGYYDLATPYLSARYTLDHLALDPAFDGHITTGIYEAGHMMYVYEPALTRLRHDLSAFVVDATAVKLAPAPAAQNSVTSKTANPGAGEAL